MFGERAEEKDWAMAIYARVRPGESAYKTALLDYRVSELTVKNGEHRSVLEVTVPPDADSSYVHNNPTGRINFEFDKVFDQDTSQDTMFDWTTEEKVSDVFNGVNSTIFAYGQTGSGKTYTMQGGGAFEERGLIPRTIACLFLEMRAKKSFKFTCQISYLEVYKEAVYDLLDPGKANTPIEAWPAVSVQESERGILLRGLNVFEVVSEEEALNLFFMGSSNRVTSSTPMNHASSRSHAIFTVVLESEGVVRGNTTTSLGKINLVDLAGSERAYKVENSQSTHSEAKAINLSLHYLEQVIVSLRDVSSRKRRKRKDRHIPYRNSVLTNLLRDSLGGNSRSSFIITLSADKLHFDESMSSCKFGQRCGEVMIQYHANSEIALVDQIRNLYMKVRDMDRDMQELELERHVLAEELATSRAQFSQVCLPRSLRSSEEAFCGAYVHSLKDHVARSVRSHSSAAYLLGGWDEGALGDLYARDKAVLVALAVRLSQHIQQEYFAEAKASATEQDERERVEEARLQAERAEAEAAAVREQAAREAQERARLALVEEQLERRAREGLEAARQSSLRRAALARAVQGDEFKKEARSFSLYSTKQARFVSVDKDHTRLQWRKLNASDEQAKYALISSFSGFESRVDTKNGKDLSASLVCTPTDDKQKPLVFEFCMFDKRADNLTVVEDWVVALRGLLQQAALGSRDSSDFVPAPLDFHRGK